MLRHQAAWTAHLDGLGISALKVNPDPVMVATEGALWGAATARITVLMAIRALRMSVFLSRRKRHSGLVRLRADRDPVPIRIAGGRPRPPKQDGLDSSKSAPALSPCRRAHVNMKFGEIVHSELHLRSAR